MTTLLPRAARAALALPALAFALFALPARAQFGAVPGGEPPKDVLRVAAAAVAVDVGREVAAEVRLTIADGWHVNANPPSPDYMIPTEVTLTPVGGLSLGRATYPPSEPLKVGFEENPIAVYGGTVTVRVPVRAGARAANGSFVLRGVVKYQACNDQVCMPPTEIPFSLVVTVAGGAEGATTPATTDVSADSAGRAPPESTHDAGATPGAGTPAPPSAASGNALADAFAKGGLWWFLALFLGGLALNLTPCVFPMIGITVSVFGARKKEAPIKVLAHAVAYVLGIALTYSVLGVVAALTGGLFGAALQNPWVNVVLGLLFVVLSLSMFGLYEMQPPAWLLQRLGGADATSLAGIFVSGLAVGVIAAPCVGPFVVAVLALIAQRGDAAFGFQTMFTLALGLGSPYLLLAMFSNLLQSMPRSGDWMLWVKKVFGVLLVAIGLYYVLIGLAPQWAPWIMPVALALGGIYLGFIDRHGSQKAGFRGFKMALGLVALALAVVSVMTLRAEGIRFEPYSDAAMQAAFAQGRPVILEFSADWCVPCHELDRYTFTDRRVIDTSRRYVVLKVDLTRYDSPESQAVRQRFGVTGVPEVLFFGGDGQELRAARVIGFMPAGPFLERMQVALGE